MASTLPSIAPGCCVPDCEDGLTVQTPGPEGAAGAAGAAGASGKNAFTNFTANFTIPAEGASSLAALTDTSFLAINQIVYGAKIDGSVVATLQVTAIASSISATLKNLEDTATGAYTDNSAPGSILTTGSILTPAGLQGPGGTTSGAAAGNLKGTYPNPLIGIGNALGSILAGNGTDTVAVAAGTNGHMLAYDSTDAEGLKSFKALPLLADTGSADNRIARLDRPAGTEVPVPMQPSLVTITDTGAIRADGSGGNARGTDAVDLQVTRNAVTQVASGTRSFIGGGERNSALGTECVIGGGDSNICGAGGGANDHAFVGGGNDNQATGEASVSVGGDTNLATAQEAFVGGGNHNTSSGLQSGVACGDSNTSSATESFIGGGGNNVSSGLNSTVAGGDTNGSTGPYSHVSGGKNALADKHGQKAWSAGGFSSVAGSSQAMSLIWSLITLNTAPNKPLFLDGASLLATITAGKTWAFNIIIVGRSAAGVCAAWEVKGAIQNNAGTTALVSAVTTAVIADGTGATWGVAGNVVVEADNANDALNIRVAATVDPAVTVRWTAEMRAVEIAH